MSGVSPLIVSVRTAILIVLSLIRRRRVSRIIIISRIFFLNQAMLR
jgi:hypothetical protein